MVDDTSVSVKLGKANGSLSAKTAALPPGVNRWSGRPYSQRYYEILEKRKTLPVWQQKEEFLHVLKANQTLILVGETGSGKTTQVCYSDPLGRHTPSAFLIRGHVRANNVILSAVNSVVSSWFL